MYSPGQAEFKRVFQLSPITLVGGIAGNIPGGALPIITLLNPGGSLLGSSDVGLDDVFGNFYPIPGSSLIENQLGEYPFANLAIAANAIVKQPLNVSLLMVAPVNDGTYWEKLAVMTGLQNTLANHCAQGGTFIVATPSYYYNNCILVGMHDVSGGETLQAQVQWRFDFRRPLLSTGDGGSSLNPFMAALASGQQVNARQTGRALQTPQSVGSPAILHSSANAASAGVPSS